MARYNRGCLGNTISAAQDCASQREKDVYVFATGNGYLIDNEKPAFSQSYYIVHPLGNVDLSVYDCETGKQEVKRVNQAKPF